MCLSSLITLGKIEDINHLWIRGLDRSLVSSVLEKLDHPSLPEFCPLVGDILDPLVVEGDAVGAASPRPNITQEISLETKIEGILRKAKGIEDYMLDVKGLYVCSRMPLPEKFKMPGMDGFDGTGDPCTHLRMYVGALKSIGMCDELLAQLFQRSLTAADLKWFLTVEAAQTLGDHPARIERVVLGILDSLKGKRCKDAQPIFGERSAERNPTRRRRQRRVWGRRRRLGCRRGDVEEEELFYMEEVYSPWEEVEWIVYDEEDTRGEWSADEEEDHALVGFSLKAVFGTFALEYMEEKDKEIDRRVCALNDDMWEPEGFDNVNELLGLTDENGGMLVENCLGLGVRVFRLQAIQPRNDAILIVFGDSSIQTFVKTNTTVLEVHRGEEEIDLSGFQYEAEVVQNVMAEDNYYLNPRVQKWWSPASLKELADATYELAVATAVLNFMWLKFFLIWRYFRFWSLISGIEAPENMPKCINNCYNLESFWKNWHASFNKWLVRKLLSWAWLTCIFFVPEMIAKSAANAFQVRSAFGEFVFREVSAVAGAITITCLMVANLVGYVIGPSGMNWLISRFLQKEGLPTLGGMFVTFYVGTKLMFHIRDAKEMRGD
ncbi:MBOAT (membrane bound O-acyl transferase) family protein [Actinidia rufa]|uniref:MBOAT (Membrane bound O-acyl transferase) family protein n=1 Tax=Actinidia rufa TaxID=165716 RepID=A0A7J0GFB9_9ERIC|nr:MBOAT (membrane bound O-acyl transferase) family protein [Actinidia rufa]